MHTPFPSPDIAGETQIPTIFFETLLISLLGNGGYQKKTNAIIMLFSSTSCLHASLRSLQPGPRASIRTRPISGCYHAMIMLVRVAVAVCRWSPNPMNPMRRMDDVYFNFVMTGSHGRLPPPPLRSLHMHVYAGPPWNHVCSDNIIGPPMP